MEKLEKIDNECQMLWDQLQQLKYDIPNNEKQYIIAMSQFSRAAQCPWHVCEKMMKYNRIQRNPLIEALRTKCKDLGLRNRGNEELRQKEKDTIILFKQMQIEANELQSKIQKLTNLIDPPKKIERPVYTMRPPGGFSWEFNLPRL